uniref:sn-1-specific diacylglycerol lipase n=2 Tax=Schistocephalus solidus TaxID=70667 RepID=A0A0X3PD03_SCHSO
MTVSKPSDQLHAEWLSISRIHAYSKFASAVYGRLLYMFEHRLALPALCVLCKEISCKTCCRCCRCYHPTDHHNAADRETDPILQPSDDLHSGCCICEHDTCNYAIFSRVTGVPVSDLIYYSFTNMVYFSPFLVAIDENTRSIVIAVRGTLSTEDMIVDMLAEGARLQEEDLGPAAEALGVENPDFVVHMGILRTARQLRAAILEMRLVEKARRRRPDYPLVVCGHSLGAGVASVLALLLRSYYPEVKGYAYSPPLGLMNVQLARFCKPFVCSIVYGYDLVPRLSIPTLNDLKWRLFDALANCKVPKYRLLCRSAKLLFLRCCLPCCSWPRIGLDTRLLDEGMQQRLLNPEVYQARVSSYSTSSERSEGQVVGGQSPFSTALSPQPASGGGRVARGPITSQSCPPSHTPSYSRFRPGPRSLVCWLKDSGPLILKTAAPGTAFSPPYTDATGSILPQWSEFSSTSAPTGESASAPSYEELVSMDRNVRFAGLVLHIVEADDCPLDVDSNDSLDATPSSPWQPRNYRQKTSRRNPRVPPVAVWSSARQFQTILIHPHMMRDHLPNSITGALERLHKAFLSASPHSNLQLTSQGACLLPEGLSDPAHLVRRIKNAAR